MSICLLANQLIFYCEFQWKNQSVNIDAWCRIGQLDHAFTTWSANCGTIIAFTWSVILKMIDLERNSVVGWTRLHQYCDDVAISIVCWVLQWITHCPKGTIQTSCHCSCHPPPNHYDLITKIIRVFLHPCCCPPPLPPPSPPHTHSSSSLANYWYWNWWHRDRYLYKTNNSCIKWKQENNKVFIGSNGNGNHDNGINNNNQLLLPTVDV